MKPGLFCPTSEQSDLEAPEVIAGLELYDAGLNVFPTPRGCKTPFGPHALLQTTRLYRPALPNLVEGCNLAVMAGRCSANTFILDCDDPHSFTFVGAALAARNIPAWVRNGAFGGQYWLRCADGEVQNKDFASDSLCGKLQILGRGKYSMAPPSIHPTGMLYAWIACEGETPPVIPLAALDFLPMELASKRRACETREKSTALSPVADAVLFGDTSRYGGDNSTAEYAACLSMLAAGYSDDGILQRFRALSPPHYRKVGERNFCQYILEAARTWLSRQPERTSPGESVHSSYFSVWANSVPWPGRTGNTDKAVYLALCERMRCEGGMPFRASVREVAEWAQINTETASKAITRLITCKRVRTVGMEESSGARRFGLLPPEEGDATDSMTTRPSPRSACLRHDVWERIGLGKSAQLCYGAMLHNTPQSVKALALTTGKTRPTIHRAVGKLCEQGLANENEMGWQAVPVPVETLDWIARDLGALGKGAKRKRKHGIERQKHASAVIADQKARYLRMQEAA